MKIKKITLLLTILCVSILNGMEPTSLSELRRPGKETTYEDTYAPLFPELKQHILNIALANSNDLLDAIKTIKAFSILHRINYNLLIQGDVITNVLTHKFPEIVKDVVIFAITQPDLYQKIIRILEEKPIEKAIGILKKENILQDNLKDFTILT